MKHEKISFYAKTCWIIFNVFFLALANDCDLASRVSQIGIVFMFTEKHSRSFKKIYVDSQDRSRVPIETSVAAFSLKQ